MGGKRRAHPRWRAGHCLHAVAAVSGVAGVFRLASDDGGGFDRALLQDIARSLASRGPDGTGIWHEGAAALVHTLFETSNRHATLPRPQPRRSGDLVIVADARIDARAELLRELLAGGAAIAQDADDAALLLATYRLWGDDCATHIIGDFAFVIWDARRHRVFGARDHFGVKPFYYAQTPEDLVIANTLDTVLVHPRVSRALDDEAVVNFLLFGYNTNEHSTTYARVKTLPPAHSLVLEDAHVRITRYWSLPSSSELRYGSPRDYAEHFTGLFDAAVADRMPSGSCAILMSGGTDSTAVAATAHKLLSAGTAPAAGLHAFCAGYRELFEDAEPSYAALAARSLDIPFTFVALDRYRAYERLDGELRTPEPQNNPLFAAEHDTYVAAAALARVALTGNGGDAVLRETRSHLVRLVAAGKPATAAREALEYARVHRKLPRPGLRTWLKERRGALLSRGRVPAWLRPELANELGVEARIAEVERRPRDVHPLRPEAFMHLSGAFWSRCLEECDMAGTGVPLEMRHPFLDVRLVEFALSVPPAQWYNDKGVLRLAVHHLLPPAIVRRGKAPLAGDPLRAVFRRDGRNWIGQRQVTSNIDAYVSADMLPAEVGGRATRPASAELDQELRPLTLSLWLT
jgi:asparagine synthase (glutamine-hydrolysing)